MNVIKNCPWKISQTIVRRTARKEEGIKGKMYLEKLRNKVEGDQARLDDQWNFFCFLKTNQSY